MGLHAALSRLPQWPNPSCPSTWRPPCRTTTFLTYSGRHSQDLQGSKRLADTASAANGDWEGGGAEFLDALSGGPSRRASHDGEAAKAPAASAEELAAVRQALAGQQAREVPEEERWAVQVGRGRPCHLGRCMDGRSWVRKSRCWQTRCLLSMLA